MKGYVENFFNGPPGPGEISLMETEVVSVNSIAPNLTFYLNNDRYTASFPYDLGSQRPRQFLIPDAKLKELKGKKITIGYVPVKALFGGNEGFIWSLSEGGVEILTTERIYSYREGLGLNTILLVKLLVLIVGVAFCLYIDKKENR